MSFRCERCGEPQPPRARPVRKVTSWRTLQATYDHPDVKEIAEEQDWCERCAGIVSGTVEKSEESHG